MRSSGADGCGSAGFGTEGADCRESAARDAGLAGLLVSMFMGQRYDRPWPGETRIAGGLCQCTFVADSVCFG